MLYEYLCSNYKPNEPIFVADVSLPVSNVNLRQMFKYCAILERSGDLIQAFTIFQRRVD